MGQEELLKGKVALVTGASRGIGRAIAKELARCGASVAVNYISSKAAAEELVSKLSADGVKAVALQADISQPEEAKRLVGEAAASLGGLHILVNNAGINRDRTLRRMTVEEWRAVMGTNLDGMYYCTSAALEPMTAAGGGYIINISSIIGQTGNIGQANYAATKAGIIGFTKSAAQELARYKILVNAVCPGFIETEMVVALADNIKAGILARVPLGRFGRPDEVASLVRYLVTEGGYITGQTFSVNGGMYM